MNDRVSRVANSNIASEARKTYIQELTKLDLDVNTLLLGSNMRLAASDHYFSDGGKVGKAFSQLPDADKDLFEQAVEELISNEAVDAFNKLHFYNTLSHYHYHLGKSARKEKVAGKLEQMAAFMPFPISSRLEDPHKELKDLLFREKHLLDQFHILRSSIGHIYSYRYSGNCWIAKIREKYGNPQLVYSLTMPVKDSITPLSGFLKQKPLLTKRIEDHAFLQKLLKADPGNKLILRFTEDRSFSNYKNKVLKELPEAVKENRSFENAISFSISYPDGNYVKYLLFENNDLLLFEIPMDFSLPGYTFRELVTNTKESLFSVSYESYKIFNEQGEMLN